MNPNYQENIEWKFFGHTVPRSEVVWVTLVGFVFLLLAVALLNLSLGSTMTEFWVSLVSFCLGTLKSFKRPTKTIYTHSETENPTVT